jgi:hypothetical protein
MTPLPVMELADSVLAVVEWEEIPIGSLLWGDTVWYYAGILIRTLDKW